MKPFWSFSYIFGDLLGTEKNGERDLSDVSYTFDDYSQKFAEPYPNLKEPVLDYHPSEYQRNSELIFVGLGTAAVCYGAYKYM